MSIRSDRSRGAASGAVALLGVVLLAHPAMACGDGAHTLPRTCCRATIRVRVPEGTGTVYLTGSLPELGPWNPAARALTGRGPERSIELSADSGTVLEYKFTLGSWDTEALTAAGQAPPNYRLVLTHDTTVSHELPRFKTPEQAAAERQATAARIRDAVAHPEGSGVEGRLVYWTDVKSAFLGPTRNVEIWLPPGYDQDTTRRYPVLYMHDGQNLFDPRIANTGTDWGVDEAVMRLVRKGVIPPIIVVGAWSTEKRFEEYSPWQDAPQYARFLIEELMPRVNHEFRARTGPANTATMGSSMGGLLSFYLVTHHPEVFGACGCESTHFPLSPAVAGQIMQGDSAAASSDTVPYVIRDIEGGMKAPSHARYRFDYGSEGLDAAYGPTHEAVRRWLLAQGKVEGRDFVIKRYEGATHNEASWRARLEDPLTFIFGRPRQ